MLETISTGAPELLVRNRSAAATMVRAEKTLRAAAGFWFVAAVAGQWMFAFYIALFYGRAVAAGDLAAWNTVMPHGYVPGDTLGNGVIAAHLLAAAFVMTAGALQLVPQIRKRAPTFHRWTGRLYLVSALLLALGGLYMVWGRGGGGVGDLSQHLAISLNALLILLCGALALRYALARDFRTHRRWALRLFLVMAGVWFFRVGLMLSFIIFRRPFGFDPASFTGPFLTFLAFAQYLLPLAVLELYFQTQSRPGALRRYAMAASLFVLTLAMSGGIFAATFGMWLRRL